MNSLDNSLRAIINAKGRQYGIDPSYLERTALIESSGNPYAQNPNSSAGGLFQFTNGTARDYGLTNKYDPVAATDAAARLTADNARILRNALGREPTNAELYLAHQQGAGGALKLLTNPNADATSLVNRDAILNNRGAQGQTARDFVERWQQTFNGNNGTTPRQPNEQQQWQVSQDQAEENAPQGQTFIDDFRNGNTAKGILGGLGVISQFLPSGQEEQQQKMQPVAAPPPPTNNSLELLLQMLKMGKV